MTIGFDHADHGFQFPGVFGITAMGHRSQQLEERGPEVQASSGSWCRMCLMRSCRGSATLVFVQAPGVHRSGQGSQLPAVPYPMTSTGRCLAYSRLISPIFAIVSADDAMQTNISDRQ